MKVRVRIIENVAISCAFCVVCVAPGCLRICADFVYHRVHNWIPPLRPNNATKTRGGRSRVTVPAGLEPPPRVRVRVGDRVWVRHGVVLVWADVLG